MSNIYVLPATGAFDEIIEVTQRAKVPLHTPSTLREFILSTATEESPIQVATLTAEQILLLNRAAEQLLDQLPTVIVAAPGVFYQGDWMTTAASFPVIDWLELKSKLSKSGHTAYSRAALQSKDSGILVMRPTAVDEPPAGGLDEEDEPEQGY